jgi:signal transduction histidine kinase
MNDYRISLLLALFFLIGWCGTAQADLILKNSARSVPLAGHMAILAHAPSNASFETIVSGQAGAFKPLAGNFMGGFGAARDVWLRFTLLSDAPQSVDWLLRVLPTYLEQVDLYQPDGQSWQVTAGGGKIPLASRAMNDRAMVFTLRLAPNEPRTFYLHLRHEGAFNAYPVLYTPAQYQRLLNQEGLMFGLYFGVAALLLLINLVHWFSLREIIFIEFGFYLVIRVLYFLCYDGLAYQWFLPNAPAFLHDALRFLLAWVVATIAPILVHVLDIQRLYPRLAKFCWTLGGLAALLSITVFTGQFARLGGLLSVIVLLFGVIGAGVAVLELRHNRPLGWLILLTMLVMLGGFGTSALASFGFSSGLFLDVYGGQIASFAVFLALHFAITQRAIITHKLKIMSEHALQLATDWAEREATARREQASFFAMLFHEIKTPLAEISSAATVLEQLDDGAHPETGTRYDTIHRAVEHLNLTVEQNLARDRQGIKEIHLTRQAVEPMALIRAVLNSFQGTHPHRLTTPMAAELPCVQGDPEFLRVALANLVDNAIKYSPNPGEIHFAAKIKNSHIEFVVQDHGIGMSQETMQHAFDRYWRGEEVGSITGNGLGLYLVRRIAQAHGGDVHVTSRKGHGSRFTLSIPLAPA